MSWGRDFRELGDKLQELADQFKQRGTGRISGSGQADGLFVSPQGFDAKRRIGAGINDAMNEQGTGIVDQAEQRASRHVPREAAATIQHKQIAWNRHQFGATHELVKYHEYGTSTKADDTARATINAPDGNGYVIPIDGYDSLPFGPDQVAMMDEMNFQFVVHPGVEGKHFLRDTLRGNTWLIEEKVAEQLDDIEIDV